MKNLVPVTTDSPETPVLVGQWGAADYQPPEDLLLGAWETIVSSVIWGTENYEEIAQQPVSYLNDLPFVDRLEGVENGLDRLQRLIEQGMRLNADEVETAVGWLQDRIALYQWWIQEQTTQRGMAAGRG